jgi:hypothetical protein
MVKDLGAAFVVPGRGGNMATETAIRDTDYNEHIWMAHEEASAILLSDEAAGTAVLRGIAVAYPRQRFARLAGRRLTAEAIELN